MQAELTIGDFSRITHLSIKTLRHYHRVGLLEPAEVNPDSGYRYYTVAQVPVAQTIRRFRNLDMPVDEVRAVLEAPDATSRDALIAAHLDRMQTQLAQTQSAVESLRALLTEPTGPAIKIERRMLALTVALAITATVERSQLLDWWTAAMAELPGTVARTGMARNGAPGGIFANSLFTDDHGEATVFIPLGRPRPSGAPDQADLGRARITSIPGTEVALARLDGSHRDVDQVYAALGSYVAELGLDGTGPVREYYLATPADPNEWRTEICWPIG
jgi:DNA-binding transcriptional MerR regulator/effector-binding domain-containing protein